MNKVLSFNISKLMNIKTEFNIICLIFNITPHATINKLTLYSSASSGYNQEFYFSITYVCVHRLGKVKSLPLHERSLKILIKLIDAIDIDVILPKVTMRT